MAQAWGKLVKVDSSPASEVLLVNRECTVGRKKGFYVHCEYYYCVFFVLCVCV